MLGGLPDDSTAEYGELVPVVRVAVRASAGPGAIPGQESTRPYFAFDPRWLRALTDSPASKLSLIRVEGDSMAPTLSAGDDILVDLADGPERLRDGIYVLRVDGALLVKRLAIHPVGRRVTVQSDNPAYGDLPDCGLDEIDCIGRVIWTGRRIA
jgi:phage repressor protein C with HTH and peptisase S24 domain